MNSPRTIISVLNVEDFQEILEMYSEPDSFRYIAPHKDKSQDYYLNFLNGKVESNNLQPGFWVVRDIFSKELIGTVNLNKFRQTDMYHVGCHLKTKFWNQGFGKELCEVVIQHGFENLHLKEIHGIVEEENLVSAKLMKSLGFGIKESIVIEGSKLNVFYFSDFNSV